MALNLRTIAMQVLPHTPRESDTCQADAAHGKAAGRLPDAAQQLMKCFSQCITAAPATSKKLGSLPIINQLFKIYFHLNTLRLCKNLIRAVESPGFPSFERFPKSHTVTYRYYVGRLSIFEGDLVKAESELQYAFDTCTTRQRRNKWRILIYLVPVRLLLGVMPSPRLLDKYGLIQYSGLAQAVRVGDLRAFNDEISRHQEFFINRGVFLVLERLRVFALRNAFKRIHVSLGQSRLPIVHIQTGLRVMGVEMDADAIECVLANLIHQACVKGYISYQHRTVVLSKENAFPPWAALARR